MSVIHSIVAYARGGVDGMQAGQRDFSPFVAHFTSYSAMEAIRGQGEGTGAVAKGTTPCDLKALLDVADSESMGVVGKIMASRSLKAGPPGKGIQSCVCMSESTLPGLLALSERFGRFGFVFHKDEIWSAGGRPCAYVDSEVRARLLEHVRCQDATCSDRKMLDLSCEVKTESGGVFRDFTHLREWRVFADLSLRTTPPVLLVAPSEFVDAVAAAGAACMDKCPQVIPIDMLFEWGV
jgi:hypothetical protein